MNTIPDNEIWLRAWCAAIVTGGFEYAARAADGCLKDYKSRFCDQPPTALDPKYDFMKG